METYRIAARIGSIPDVRHIVCIEKDMTANECPCRGRKPSLLAARSASAWKIFVAHDHIPIGTLHNWE